MKCLKEDEGRGNKNVLLHNQILCNTALSKLWGSSHVRYTNLNGIVVLTSYFQNLDKLQWKYYAKRREAEINVFAQIDTPFHFKSITYKWPKLI